MNEQATNQTSPPPPGKCTPPPPPRPRGQPQPRTAPPPLPTERRAFNRKRWKRSGMMRARRWGSRGGRPRAKQKMGKMEMPRGISARRGRSRRGRGDSTKGGPALERDAGPAMAAALASSPNTRARRGIFSSRGRAHTSDGVCGPPRGAHPSRTSGGMRLRLAALPAAHGGGPFGCLVAPEEEGSRRPPFLLRPRTPLHRSL